MLFSIASTFVIFIMVISSIFGPVIFCNEIYLQVQQESENDAENMSEYSVGSTVKYWDMNFHYDVGVQWNKCYWEKFCGSQWKGHQIRHPLLELIIRQHSIASRRTTLWIHSCFTCIDHHMLSDYVCYFYILGAIHSYLDYYLLCILIE